jgi:hypothetical protein
MISFLKQKKQADAGPSQDEQVRIDDENEYLAMSCGSFNPRFLAKIRRSKGETLEQGFNQD